MRRLKHKEVSSVPVMKKEECSHYWVIEGATGPISLGVCKFCGAVREFHNSFPEFDYLKRNPRVLKEISELLEAESDKEPDDSELEKTGACL